MTMDGPHPDALNSPQAGEQLDAREAEALRILGAQSDALLNAVDEGVYCLDADGNTLFVNEAGLRMLGFTAREMRGKSQHALIHYRYADGTPFPEEACPIYSSVHDGVHQRVGGDIFWRKDGSALPVDYTSMPIREGRRILGAVVTFRDISGQQEAQAQADRLASERAARAEAELARKELELSRRRFRLALDAGNMGSWEWDIAGGRVIWSPEVEGLFGIPEASFSGTMEEYASRIHPDDRDASTGLVQTALAERRATHHVLHRIVWPDGSVHWLESNGHFIYDDEGNPLRLTGVSSDVTDVRAEAEARRASEENYRFLTESLPVQVWTAQPDGQLDYVTQRVADFFGKPASEILRDGWKDVVHPDDLPRAGAAWMHSVATGDPYSVEFRLRRHDGEYGWHLSRAIAQRSPSGAILRWFGTNTDIEDQKRTESALADATRGTASRDGRPRAEPPA
jgi:PAS domain S-box-containing protein